MTINLQRAFSSGIVIVKKPISVNVDISIIFNNTNIPNYVIKTNTNITLTSVRSDITVNELRNSNLENMVNSGFLIVVEEQATQNEQEYREPAILHSILYGRNEDLCHPIEAVSNLKNSLNNIAENYHTHTSTDLNNLQEYINEHQGGVGYNIHNNIPQRNEADCHPISSITDLQSEINLKADINHSHFITDVTGLQTALNGKIATTHSHSISDVTLLQDSLNAKAPSLHTHIITDVTGLGTAIGGKITSLTNLGTDEGIYTSLSGTTAQFKRLKGEAGVVITSDTTNIAMSTPGASSEYIVARLSNSGSISVGSKVLFNTVLSSNVLTLVANAIVLNAGKIYEIEADIHPLGDATSLEWIFKFYNETTGQYFDYSSGLPWAPAIKQTYSYALPNGAVSNFRSKLVFTPSIQTSVSVKLVSKVTGWPQVPAGTNTTFYYESTWIRAVQIL